MIDINKKYRTHDGREVRIYATDGGHENCMAHGAVKNKTGGWEIVSWYNETGKYYINDARNHPYDLIEVRPRHKRTVWLNVIKDSYGDLLFSAYVSEKDAKRSCYDRTLACIKVELDFEEGEGQ